MSEVVAITVIGTNLVMDYGTHERAIAAMDAMPERSAGAGLAPLLPDAEPVRILREWVAAINDVRASKRGANERLVQAQQDACTLLARLAPEGTER